jgi:hypothetical protein
VVALVGRAADFVGEDVVVAAGFLGVSFGVKVETAVTLDVDETIPGASTDSSWSHILAATSSLLNSRALCVPAATGAVNRGQSVDVACLREGSVLETARASES